MWQTRGKINIFFNLINFSTPVVFKYEIALILMNRLLYWKSRSMWGDVWYIERDFMNGTHQEWLAWMKAPYELLNRTLPSKNYVVFDDNFSRYSDPKNDQYWPSLSWSVSNNSKASSISVFSSEVSVRRCLLPGIV